MWHFILGNKIERKKTDKLKHMHNSQHNSANSYNPIWEAIAKKTHVCPEKQNIKNNMIVMISFENEKAQFKEWGYSFNESLACH